MEPTGHHAATATDLTKGLLRGSHIAISQSGVMSCIPLARDILMIEGQYSTGMRFARFHAPTATGLQFGIEAATTLFPPSASMSAA